jgi:alpha-galactosidase
MVTVYSLALLSERPDLHCLLAFTSCRRFSGLIRLNCERIEVVLNTEDLELAPGQSWELEEFTCMHGPDHNLLLTQLAQRIEHHHPRLPVAATPTGWCSWYYYGPDARETDIFANLEAITCQQLPLTYVQIDDGFQSAMGDWLTAGELFPQGMPWLCQQIRERGCEPAIWIAPFIAEASSQLLREHPDWFVHDEDGKPLPSDRLSFGGWRRGPWYMLDGTHPGAQDYLELVFRTMRQEWGCHYFKLDALMWGALSGGSHYDSSATCIEAYRQGMQAILRGAGEASFILGCNAPMWPSLGVVHGMRVSGDIARSWEIISSVARECFLRNWQHQRLWINDPDCVVLENRPFDLTVDPGGKKKRRPPATLDEFLFHATAIYASGGMVLSGDNLASLSDEKLATLRKLLPPTDQPASFDDASCRIGRIESEDHLKLCLFNWDDTPSDMTVALPGSYLVHDFWTGEELGQHQQMLQIRGLAAHAARLLVCYPI